MLKKFVLWFVCFGLSCLVEFLGWGKQGYTFLFIYLLAICLIIAFLITFDSLSSDDSAEKRRESLVNSALKYLTVTLIIIFPAGLATFLFNVDYCLVFQIMTFCHCLYLLSKKKQSNHIKDKI